MQKVAVSMVPVPQHCFHPPLKNREFQKVNLRMNGGLLEIVLLEKFPVAVLHVVPVLVHRAVLLPRMGRLRSKT